MLNAFRLRRGHKSWTAVEIYRQGFAVRRSLLATSNWMLSPLHRGDARLTHHIQIHPISKNMMRPLSLQRKQLMMTIVWS